LRIPLTIREEPIEGYGRWLSYYEVERTIDGKIL